MPHKIAAQKHNPAIIPEIAQTIPSDPGISIVLSLNPAVEKNTMLSDKGLPYIKRGRTPQQTDTKKMLPRIMNSFFMFDSFE